MRLPGEANAVGPADRSFVACVHGCSLLLGRGLSFHCVYVVLGHMEDFNFNAGGFYFSSF